MFTGSARQHDRRRATACTLRVAALLRAALTLWAVGAVPAPPAGGVWVEVLSPRDGAALYADESARITYRTSSLPAGALVRLSINGKEALRNPNTEVTVDVPGLIAGRHEVAVEVLDAGGAPLADRRVRFEVRTGYSWVAKYVLLADEAAAATCSAADVCTFLIDARGDGSTPSSGHFFRVRLVGPAIVMGSIHELNSTGVYQVTYRAVDAGVYSMSVVLLHASNTGIADPGEGIPRQFLDQHIAASPLQSDRVDQADAPQFAQDPWIWVPHGCVLRRYDGKEAHACLAQAWWTGGAKKGDPKKAEGHGHAAGAPASPGAWGAASGWWKYGRDGLWQRSPLDDGSPPDDASLHHDQPQAAPPDPHSPAHLYLSGTSLVRTMYYDIVCLLHPACNATKEHEDLAFAGGKGGARVAFHWFARFADHVLFADPPLGRVDDRTGRLAYNTTLTDLLESIAQVAHSPHSIIVLGSQIFDILKAPLGDYRTNLALLIQHVIPHVKGTVVWRTGEALHDATLDAGWDFGANPGRYMNDPRMQEANRIAVEMMRQAGVAVLDLHAVTHGREDRSHDGTHYWNQKILGETESRVRKGNGVSYTCTQILLNWLCNS